MCLSVSARPKRAHKCVMFSVIKSCDHDEYNKDTVLKLNFES